MVLSLADIVSLSRLLDVGMDLERVRVDAWLAGLPEEDRHLQESLREMLHRRSDDASSGFLADGPKLTSPQAGDSGAVPDEHIGPYRLIRELGRGGMGTVWLAERFDGSLKRQTALKMPRLVWGAGLSERMRRERDISALLEHPNIARLYDAGVDERGRPYLALEYVDGQPLDSWCRDRALTVRERLGLFLQVARAVAYAHGRLVVHCDIKPSNVLVTADGQAHLMDFGIAKLLTDSLGAGDGLTREHGLMLTPRNASPEQLRGGTLTVASDIYSLGILLYEVLTGTHPYVVKRNTPAAFEEAILEGEPMLASQRAEVPGVARRLRGDVDAVLAKALKRDPADRYGTVDALAADISRHLNGEAVLARPDRLSYRLAKVVRRHRLAVFAAGAVLAAVLAGAGKSWIEARRADAEAERARLVKEFVVGIFDTKVGPDGAIGQMPGISLLERAARSIDGTFGGQPMLRAEIYGVVSTMFYNVDNLREAANYAHRQIDTLAAAHAPNRQVAAALLALTEILIPLERNSEALAAATEALARADGDRAIEAQAHARKALALLFGHADIAAAEPELDAADAALQAHRASTSDLAEIALARGVWFGFKKLPDLARAQFDDAIAMGEAAEGPMSILALHAREEAAKTLLLADRVEAGQPYLKAAVAMMRAAGGPDDPRAAMWESYGANWMLRGDAISLSEALRVFEHSLASLRAQKWPVPRSDIESIESRMGLAYLQWGDVERGASLAVLGNTGVDPKADPVTQWWRDSVTARALAPTERAEEAVLVARRLLPTRKSEGNYDLRLSYKLLAVALVHARRYREAESVLAEFDRVAAPGTPMEPESRSAITLDEVRDLVALELGKSAEVIAMTASLRPVDRVHQDEVAWLSRAAALCRTGAADEGQALFARWLPRLATDRYQASPHLAYWRARMGLCALQQGQRAEAGRAADLAGAALAAQPRISAHYKAPVEELLRQLRRG